MSSVGSHILNHTRTGGHFISIGVASAVAVLASAYVVPPSSGTGYLNAAGSCFNYATAANAGTAIAAAFVNTGELDISTAGILLEDMGDRILFSAAGQTIAIFAKVRALTVAAYEGAETQLYTCIWAGNPAGTSPETLVGVARL